VYFDFFNNFENTGIWQNKNFHRSSSKLSYAYQTDRLTNRQTNITNIVTFHNCPLNMPNMQVKEDIMWMIQQNLHSGGGTDSSSTFHRP